MEVSTGSFRALSNWPANGVAANPFDRLRAKRHKNRKSKRLRSAIGTSDRMNLKLREFIRALPKTETHLHAEGALPYALLTAWQPERWPPNPAFRAPGYRYASFLDFER